MLRSKHVNSYSLLPMAFSKKATPLLRLKMSDSSESKKDRCIHIRKKEVNFILSYYTNLSHTGQEKFTSFFRMVYKEGESYEN